MLMRRGALAALFVLMACGARTNLGDIAFDEGGGGSGGRNKGGTGSGKGGTSAGKGGTSAGKGGTSAAGAPGCFPEPTLELQLIGYEGLTLDAQNRVEFWRDQSGQHDATQNDAVARPMGMTYALNDRAVVYFDGVDDFLDVFDGFQDFTSGFTAFVIAQPEATSPIHAARFFDLSTAYGNLVDSILFVRFNIGGSDLFYQTYLGPTPGPYVSAANRVVDAEWHMFGVVHQCGPAQTLQPARLYRDGEEVALADVYVPRLGTRSSNLIARSNIAQDTYLKGSIAEIQIWRGAMSDAQRFATEQELRLRWGL